MILAPAEAGKSTKNAAEQMNNKLEISRFRDTGNTEHTDIPRNYTVNYNNLSVNLVRFSVVGANYEYQGLHVTCAAGV